ncbi:unnamed protein product [Musa acuminata subsp. malaccensis]|uniref:(wild Malaysian banana) hypothetical protein n=1 Tax=Musa acuminata subsp. malaccensis TaxID=214687 RepID=A0A8D7B0J1_MUSAM|nr:unnamed protein product [Musa acuminata subsp. malaccensis]
MIFDNGYLTSMKHIINVLGWDSHRRVSTTAKQNFGQVSLQ